MNNDKETQRAQLHKAIWRVANDLRGSVDGWDFKQYVLGVLFYRFISENRSSSGCRCPLGSDGIAPSSQWKEQSPDPGRFSG